MRYGDEISAASLLRALPESYAAEWGAPVLIAHGDLVWQLPRRIRQTALFLLAVLTETDACVTQPGSGAPPAAPGLRSANLPPVINTASTLFQQCVWLRLFHAGIRRDLGGDATAAPGNARRNIGPSVPLNQEDLLATLLTFSVTTFRVLKAFGITLKDADREAYVFLWNLVGACLGVGTPAAGTALAFLADWNGDHAVAVRVPTGWLLPATVPSAERLLDQLQDRQWIAVQSTINAGRPFPWTDLVPAWTLVTRVARRAGRRDAAEPAGVAGDRDARAGSDDRAVPARPPTYRHDLARRVRAQGDPGRHADQELGAPADGERRDPARDAGVPPGRRSVTVPDPGLDLTQLSPVRRVSPYELRTR